MLASSVAGLVQHAAGEFVSAGENVGAVLQLVGHEDLRNGPPPDRDHLVADALKQVGWFGDSLQPSGAVDAALVGVVSPVLRATRRGGAGPACLGAQASLRA